MVTRGSTRPGAGVRRFNEAGPMRTGTRIAMARDIAHDPLPASMRPARCGPELMSIWGSIKDRAAQLQ